MVCLARPSIYVRNPNPIPSQINSGARAFASRLISIQPVSV